MGIIYGLGGLLALLAIILRAKSKSDVGEGQKPYATGLPDSVKQTIMRGEDATRTELEIAASSATMAGYPKLGDALRGKAGKAQESAEKKLTSPMKEATPEAWTRFTRVMASAAPDTVGPKGQAGIFQFTVRRLADLGIVKNPRLVGGIWKADWASRDPSAFLGSPNAQYKLFEKSMVNYRQLILERYAKAIGTTFEGHKATLSGLLAVAHCAGIDGLGKWLKNDPPRAKFKATTAAYLKANDVF